MMKSSTGFSKKPANCLHENFFAFIITIFLVLGGYHNIIINETANELTPLAILLLCWIGFLFGFQFEIPKLKRIYGKFLIAAAVKSVLTFGMVFTGTMVILSMIGDYLTTVALAEIAINQLIGPVLFKIMLDLVGESDRS